MANSNNLWLRYLLHPEDDSTRMCRTPGPLGINDYTDPNMSKCSLVGNTPGPLGVNDHADPNTKKPATIPGSSSKQLTVSEGQLTFDAEGNDDPNSRYFSRRIHWPGGVSGVTLGRGYDMGSPRTEMSLKEDLTNAGLSLEQAKLFATGATLKGKSAGEFVAKNKEKFGVISADVQKKLFEKIYPVYLARAKSEYMRHTKASKGQFVEWNKLKLVIRDVLADIAYQNWAVRSEIVIAAMTDDVSVLINFIENDAHLQQYETGRKRAKYLKNNM